MASSSSPNLECRMYEAKFPDVDTSVMVQVKSIGEMCAYVSLLEYNNIEGMILLSELSRCRIRSINGVIKVGCTEVVMVLHVDEEKGYVNLSKSRVSEEDIQKCEDRFSKSKLVHSIMRHVAETMQLDLEDLYIRVGWPLYRKYGHAIEAFRLVVNDPDSVLNSLTLIDEIVKDALVTNIRRRMTPQPLKIRADVEMKCFEFDGVLHIKAAMRKAQAVGSEDCPVKVKLVAAPSYVFITQTLDKEQGISVLTKAIAACTEEIELHKGNLTVKQPPKVVSEREDILLDEQVAKLSQADAEAEVEVVGGDDDNEDEEDTRIGDVDLDIGQEI